MKLSEKAASPKEVAKIFDCATGEFKEIKAGARIKKDTEEVESAPKARTASKAPRLTDLGVPEDEFLLNSFFTCDSEFAYEHLRLEDFMEGDDYFDLAHFKEHFLRYKRVGLCDNKKLDNATFFI